MFKLFLLLSIALLTSKGHESIADNLKIYNGQDAKPDEFPYMISLRSKDEHLCGGTLINSKWVLTAAHCLVNNQLCAQNLEILYGTIHSYHKQPAPSNHVVGVKRYFIHEEFMKGFKRSDVAVLELNSDVIVKEYVKLANKEPIRNQEIVSTVVGWGDTESGKIPDILKKVEVMVLNHTQCLFDYNKYDPKVHLCYDSRMGRACQGDSGGPLIQDGVQYGISSYGFNCKLDISKIMANVYQLKSWIDNHVH